MDQNSDSDNSGQYCFTLVSSQGCKDYTATRAEILEQFSLAMKNYLDNITGLFIFALLVL